MNATVFAEYLKRKAKKSLSIFCGHNLEPVRHHFSQFKMKISQEKTFVMQVMDQNLGQWDLSKSNTNNEVPIREINNGEKLNKCSLCDYASSQKGNLRTHFKRHSGEKPNKCNQCHYASSEVSYLGKHLKTHSGEKTNATIVIMHHLGQTFWADI